MESDAPRNSRLSFTFSPRFWAWTAVLLSPAAYLGLLGPIGWLVTHQVITNSRLLSALQLLYRPVIWLARTFPTFNDWLGWYVSLWHA